MHSFQSICHCHTRRPTIQPLAVTGTATVAALSTTPVKGLRIQRREAIELELGGVADDRRFYLIDERSKMVNGKVVGALSEIVASYDAGAGALSLRFPDGTIVAGSVELGEWVDTRFFSRDYRARLVPGAFSAAISEHAGRFLRLVHGDPQSGRGVDRGLVGAVSLVGGASVTQLAELAGVAVDSRRFRMLVEVSGLPAHAEDGWVGREVRVGDALVRMHGHIGRCLVTGRDPDTGVSDLDTLELLRSYRAGVATSEPLACGIYGEVIKPGTVRLGDAVVAVDR